jgi:colicin import membrane protein
MTSKATLNANEWKLIKDAPEWVFAALSAAEANVAVMTKAKEWKGFSKAVKGFESRNQLIRDVIADKSKPDKAIKRATFSDAEEALEEISDVLDKRVGRLEADDFRDFLLAIGEAVAEAAGEGMLGAGKKVSKKEVRALQKIEAALKATEADKKARRQAEAAEAARVAAAAKAKREAAAKAKQEAAAKARREAAAKAKQEAAAKAKREAKARPKSRRKVKDVREERPAMAKAKRGAKKAAVSTPAAPAKTYIAEHTVVSGDSLSGIAKKFYGSTARDKWMAIYEENKDIIGDNPNLIHPGQVFKIPKLD